MTSVIFEVFFGAMVGSFILLTFPLMKNPISQAGMLMIISVYLVSLIGFTSSLWFSYVLFLVYVGGLLVMFIYICLISSNYPFNFSVSWIVSILSMSLIMAEIIPKPYKDLKMAHSSFSSGESLVYDVNIALFVSLIVLLLMVLLIVVRSAGVGAVSVGS